MYQLCDNNYKCFLMAVGSFWYILNSFQAISISQDVNIHEQENNV